MSHITRLDYMRCSDRELKKFIQDRELGFSQRQFQTWDLSDKAQYLGVADKAGRFDFLDLLPELRNLVYSELLTLRQCTVNHNKLVHCSGYCYPQILATCRQIHHEAKGIFLEENRWHLKVLANYYTFGIEDCDAGNNNNAVPVGLRKVHSDWISQACTSPSFGLPSTLIQIRRLKFVVEIGRADENRKVNTTLMIFAHFIHRRHSLQKVELIIRLRPQTSSELAAMVSSLYPLSSLRSIKQVLVKVTPEQTQDFRVGDVGLKEFLELSLPQPYASLSPKNILIQRQRHQELIILAKRYRDWLRDSLKANHNEQAEMWLNGLTSVWLPEWKRYWHLIYGLFTEEEEENILKHTDEVELTLNKFKRSNTFKRLSERALQQDLELINDESFDDEV